MANGEYITALGTLQQLWGPNVLYDVVVAMLKVFEVCKRVWHTVNELKTIFDKFFFCQQSHLETLYEHGQPLSSGGSQGSCWRFHQEGAAAEARRQQDSWLGPVGWEVQRSEDGGCLLRPHPWKPHPVWQEDAGRPVSGYAGDAGEEGLGEIDFRWKIQKDQMAAMIPTSG